MNTIPKPGPPAKPSTSSPASSPQATAAAALLTAALDLSLLTDDPRATTALGVAYALHNDLRTPSPAPTSASSTPSESADPAP